MKPKQISAKKFYLQIMEEMNCSLADVVEAVESLKEKGLVKVAEYNNEGTPIKFWRYDTPPR
jgi:hypothetical protein